MTAPAMIYASELIAADLLEVAARWVARIRDRSGMAEREATIAVARGVIDLAVALLVGAGMPPEVAARRIADCAGVVAEELA